MYVGSNGWLILGTRHIMGKLLGGGGLHISDIRNGMSDKRTTTRVLHGDIMINWPYMHINCLVPFTSARVYSITVVTWGDIQGKEKWYIFYTVIVFIGMWCLNLSTAVHEMSHDLAAICWNKCRTYIHLTTDFKALQHCN